MSQPSPTTGKLTASLLALLVGAVPFFSHAKSDRKPSSRAELNEAVDEMEAEILRGRDEERAAAAARRHPSAEAASAEAAPRPGTVGRPDTLIDLPSARATDSMTFETYLRLNQNHPALATEKRKDQNAFKEISKPAIFKITTSSPAVGTPDAGVATGGLPDGDNGNMVQGPAGNPGGGAGGANGGAGGGGAN